MKRWIACLLQKAFQWIIDRYLLGNPGLTQAQRSEDGSVPDFQNTEKPTYEEDVRQMDKALADGDADAVTGMFDRLSGDAPPIRSRTAGVPPAPSGNGDHPDHPGR